uniref:AAA+ ATPase domain-containing protein n=1 Tax=Oryza meridionalis TaxID=40149 RepID=A0A0E0EH94_9ORYZ
MIEGRRHSVDIPISRALLAVMRSRSLRDPETNSLAKFSAKKTIWEGCSLEEDDLEGSNYGRHSFSYNMYDHLQRRREEFGDSARSGRLVNSPINIIKANARVKAALHNQTCSSVISGMSRATKDRASSLMIEGEQLGRREGATFQESARSLLQKYRPKAFSELAGQNVVAQSLSSAVLKGKLAPIYLFHGPHGIGKTSAARIFAASLNCHSSGGNQPCGHCEECMAIFSGNSSSVIEIDASKLDCKSRVAALLRNACEVPASSHFKVLIVDDCQHMDKEGWYSVYSSLEGIPDSSIFVMITSDIDKLPSNSVGWCQSYRFCKVDEAEIALRLSRICINEGMEFEAEALELIARKANGSIRDAVQMLDQLTLLGKRISKSVTYDLIGDVSDEELLDLLNLAFSSDAATIVRSARELLSSKNKIGCLDMNLGDPDVLETIWIKALENCTSKPLHSLLRKDGKLSSLYTTQGIAVAELQFCHPEDVPTTESFWKPLVVSLQNLLKCNVDIRINLSPISTSNRVVSKNSSVSLVMKSREDQETQDPVAAGCRTVASSRKECPSPLAAQPKEKPSHILGCLHATDGDTVDTESRILSYQKISVIPEASTPGNGSFKAGGHTPKVDEARARRGCFSKLLQRRAGAPYQNGALPRRGLFKCCFCKIRPDCKTKVEETDRFQGHSKN